MDKLYDLNSKFAKIWKLGKLQILFYPAVCFGLLASGAVVIYIAQLIQTLLVK